jgi:endonuclease YncB( thermonuclease family)
VAGEKAKGLIALDYLTRLVLGKPVHVMSIKNKGDKDMQEKYGRWLCVLLLTTPDGYKVVNQMLVDDGHAVYADY